MFRTRLTIFPATATTADGRRDLVAVDGGEGQVPYVVIFVVLGWL